MFGRVRVMLRVNVRVGCLLFLRAMSMRAPSVAVSVPTHVIDVRNASLTRGVACVVTCCGAGFANVNARLDAVPRGVLLHLAGF